MKEQQDTPISSDQPLDQAQLELKILLVEKNWPDQRLISKMLEIRGCTVTAAGNLQEAGQFLENKDIDMVLMDSNIFKNNGFDIRSAIQDSERKSGKRIPMIALSENFVRDHRERQMENGMDEYLPKPVFEAELCRAVERLAERIAYDPPVVSDLYQRNTDKVTL